MLKKRLFKKQNQKQMKNKPNLMNDKNKMKMNLIWFIW